MAHHVTRDLDLQRLPVIPRPNEVEAYTARSPSSSPSRSRSPTRATIALLERVDPPVRLCELADIPEGRVEELRSQMSKAIDAGYLPQQLQSTFGAVELRELRGLSNATNTFAEIDFGDLSADHIDEKVRTIVKLADRCRRHLMDEAAWIAPKGYPLRFSLRV
ncbi:Hypothetical protein D9617_82g010600 [Elsinoe fawcettii]|nr:Hypothetical protein D9617_82g010600 [Elsinoe fawcettii]